MVAVREAVLNALIHRDYSIHTEGMPIQLILFEDRFEIRSPGGLYGRLRIDQLGKVQPDTRNPVLAVAMETLHQTENRYSGIPTMRRELELAGMAEPEFKNERGTFVVCFRKKRPSLLENFVILPTQSILDFCEEPRTRQEIADFLHIKSVAYAIKTHVMPLVEQGELIQTIPEKPRSPKQQYVTAKK